MQQEFLDSLRHLIKEIVEEEMSEMSGVGAIGSAPPGHSISGYILPLGTSNRKKKGKKSRLKESRVSSSGESVGDEDFTFSNHVRYTNCEDGYHAAEHVEYYDSVNVLAKSFGFSNNPFGKNRPHGIKRSMNYLKGNLKYPHST
jgi:hypothetical protein